jgi:hypothetical protein
VLRSDNPRTGRIVLVTSSGGVFLDLLALEPWWKNHDVFWVAVRAADTESQLRHWNVQWEREIRIRRPMGLAPALLRASRRLLLLRPDLIVSAGTGVAVPYFVAARMLDIPSIWVSTLNLISTPGYAAKVCSRLASAVVVQRRSMLSAHPRAVVIGELY